MKKILVIATGGTIASVKEEQIRLGNPLRITEFADIQTERFECVSPFSVLSENMNFSLWQKLIDFIKYCDLKKYLGAIILHGSDTLAYTGALLANIFPGENICLVASDKPADEPGSNAAENFRSAIEHIKKEGHGVYISFDGIFPADCVVSADDEDRFIASGKPQPRIKSPVFTPKNILVIRPYVNMDYHNYNLDGVDMVLHTMYHSATADKRVLDFAAECKERKIPFYFVTTKEKAEYESAAEFENIIFNCTTENAYARLLLTDSQ